MLGARRGIGDIRGNWGFSGCRGIGGCYGHQQKCQGVGGVLGLTGTVRTQQPEGYGHQGALGAPMGCWGLLWGCQGCIGAGRACRYSGARRGIGGIRGCSGQLWASGGVGVYWGLAGSIGTQGPGV